MLSSRSLHSAYLPAAKTSVRFPQFIRARIVKLNTAAAPSEASTKMSGSNPRQLLSVAPMMDWTDLHYRQLARLISKKTWLWTEMVVDKTLLHTQNLDKFLWFPPEQRPIVCQLGGSDPETLAAAVKKVVEYGYDEINLNCGCPSDRVAGAGCFGAALMLEPELVGRCMAAMGEAAQGTPVNVKCRLGVDQVDSYDQLYNFIKTVSEMSPVTHFIIHSRKCFLKGLNPHQNRTIPPLRYEWVYGLKRDFPHLSFSLNGGIQSVYEAAAYINYSGRFDGEQTSSTSSTSHEASPSGSHEEGSGESTTSASTTPPASTTTTTTTTTTITSSPAAQQDSTTSQQQHESDGAANGVASSESYPVPAGGWLEGVMVGRQAYNDPWGFLGDADRAVFGEPSNPARSRRHVLQQYAEYADAIQGRWAVNEDGHQNPSVRAMMKPVLNLFHGEKGSKKWKSEVDNLLKGNAPSVSWVLEQSLHLIPDEVLDATPREGPCKIAAHNGITSAHEPENLTLPRLPRFGDRAGHNQDPDGVDIKRRKAGVASEKPKKASKQKESGQSTTSSGDSDLEFVSPLCFDEEATRGVVDQAESKTTAGDAPMLTTV